MIRSHVSILACVLAAFIAGCGAPAPAPPNILLIRADDLDHETLGVNGALEYETPRLDARPESGVRFTNAHSTPSARQRAFRS